MRNVLMLACLGAMMSVATLAAADTPAAPNPPAPSAAAAAPPPTPAAEPAAARAPTPAQVAAPPATAPTVDPVAQRLLAQGYTPKMRHGERVYCKSEAVLGSRLDKVERCGTLDQLRSMVQTSRDLTEEMQRIQHNPNGN